MKILRGSIVALICSFLIGCSPMRYSQFTGKGGVWPAGIWPVGSGTMAETSYRIPVYRGWPERPYKVLGSIRFEDSNKYWDDGVISMAASMGKGKGGNAIIIRQGSEFGVGKITGMKNDPSVFAYNQTTALVIRWLTPQEIREADDANKEFLRKFAAQHPDLTANQSVSVLAIQYLLQTGLSPYSDEMLERFSQIMRRISASPGEDNISGEWLYKGTLGRSSIVASDEGEGVLGMATVKMEGVNVAIVSSEGNAEINFNGTYTQGRLSGQLVQCPLSPLKYNRPF